jgi:hypothetical protein
MNFIDHETELYGIAWMGVRPNSEHGELLFCIGQGPNWLYRKSEFDTPISPDIGRERVSFGPCSWSVIAPHKTWALNYSDEYCTADLRWEAVTPVYNWEWQAHMYSWHYQHPGRVTGTVRVGDRTFTVNGYGERDRAWGQRRNGVFKACHWATVQFADHLYYEAMHLINKDGTYLFGFAQQDGKAALLSSLELKPKYSHPGGPPISAGHLATDREGRTFAIKQELLNVIDLSEAGPQGDVRLYFTFNRFTYGDKVGYGLMDHWWSDFDSLSDTYTAFEPNQGRLGFLDN